LSGGLRWLRVWSRFGRPKSAEAALESDQTRINKTTSSQNTKPPARLILGEANSAFSPEGRESPLRPSWLPWFVWAPEEEWAHSPFAPTLRLTHTRAINSARERPRCCAAQTCTLALPGAAQFGGGGGGGQTRGILAEGFGWQGNERLALRRRPSLWRAGCGGGGGGQSGPGHLSRRAAGESCALVTYASAGRLRRLFFTARPPGRPPIRPGATDVQAKARTCARSACRPLRRHQLHNNRAQ